MTTRPGAWAQEHWRNNRSKKVCNLVKVTRTDGESIHVTDLDRALTFEGATYRPILLAGMSAERREAAMKSGNQEATGIIDGTFITLPDMLGDRYRGAEVAHVITDFHLPLLVVARHRKWIRSVSFTGSAFVATLEGRTQVLTRPAGGRFGGIFTVPCPYQLGNQFCKVDMTDPTFRQLGIRVDTVTTARMSFTTTANPWTQAFDDDWFRDGDMEWRWSAPIAFGSATSGVTVTTLVDTSQSWTTNELVGLECRILAAADGAVIEWSSVISNTSDTITFSISTTYPSGTKYDVCGFAANKDAISPVVGYEDATRSITLLFPTPFPISAGDSGILRAGCNGLKTTCIDKFDNLVNFGGDADAPSAGKVLEPPPDQ